MRVAGVGRRRTKVSGTSTPVGRTTVARPEHRPADLRSNTVSVRTDAVRHSQQLHPQSPHADRVRAFVLSEPQMQRTLATLFLFASLLTYAQQAQRIAPDTPLLVDGPLV